MTTGKSSGRRPGKATSSMISKATPEIMRSVRAPKLHMVEEAGKLIEKPVWDVEPPTKYEWVWDSNSPFVQKLPQNSTVKEGTTMYHGQSSGSVGTYENCEHAVRLVAINKRQEIKIDALETCNNALVDQVADITTKYCLLGVEHSASKALTKRLICVLVCIILIVFMYLVSDYMCKGQN